MRRNTQCETFEREKKTESKVTFHEMHAQYSMSNGIFVVVVCWVLSKIKVQNESTSRFTSDFIHTAIDIIEPGALVVGVIEQVIHSHTICTHEK